MKPKPANPDGLGPRRRVVKSQPVEPAPDSEVETPEAEVAPEEPATEPTKKRFWTRRKVKWLVRLVVLTALATVALTNLRYYVLNLFLQGQAQVSVEDSKTDQPIAGVTVTIGKVSAVTDKDGNASLTKLKLGQQKLVAAKPGYQNYTDTVAVYLGHNQFGPAKMLAVGIPVSFKVSESIGQLPLSGATVTIGNVSDQTGGDGTVTLNVSPADSATVTISAPGYATQTITTKLAPNVGMPPIKLVPSDKQYFLSDRSGTIDLYQSNVDGSGQQVVLPGTGKETSSTSMLMSGDGHWVALLSSREGVRDNQGNLQNFLYLFDPSTKNLMTVDKTGTITLIGWVGDDIIYTSSPGSGQQSRLWSYNATTLRDIQLASASTINSTLILGNTVFFALNDAANPPVGVYAINADGSNKRYVYNQPASLTRTGKTVVTIDSYNDNRWFTFDAAANKLTSLPGQPPQDEDRYLQMSDSGGLGAVVLTRDGQSNLYLTDVNGQNEKAITGVGSVRFIERWIDDTYVVFRVENPNETADYIVNVDGGNAVKITNVFSGGSYYGY